MADPYNDKTYVRETRTTDTTGGGSMALIVGGLVVAVGFILWLVFGAADNSSVATDPATDTNVTIEPTAPADSTTNVTIDADEPAAEPVAPVEPAPAEPVETAPADTGTAPAADTEAPANP